jgi:hypothetical protein
MVRLSTPRVLLLAVAGLGVLHYTTNVLHPLTSLVSISSFSLRPHGSAACSPDAWAAGSWQHRPRPRVVGWNDTDMTRTEDVFKYNGLAGCAADREFFWHLAADNAGQFSRFPDATEWKWVPARDCEGVRELDTEALVRHLVEEGGWLVLGGTCFLLASCFGRARRRSWRCRRLRCGF